MSKFNKIRTLLKAENPAHVSTLIAYCGNQLNAKNQKTKYFFEKVLTPEKVAEYFLKVKAEGLVLDGKRVVITTRGLSYDYIAYKNKLLNAYPETKLDFGLVHRGDKFSNHKESGKVFYTHESSNPFGEKWETLIGAYIIIKNQRGEFIERLSKLDIEKHRLIAKDDSIWKKWPLEMALKTIIKKGCRVHFEDLFSNMNEEDNKQNDLTLLSSEEVKAKNKQDVIQQVKSDLAACVRIQDVLLYEQNNPELKKNVQTGTMIEQAKKRTVKALKAWIDDDKNVKDGEKLDAIFEKSFAEYRDAFSKVSEPPTWWVELKDAFDNRKQQLG